MLILGSAFAEIILEQIKTLLSVGVSADEIIKAIEREKPVFRLSVS
jgi:hypothetical protein